MQKSEGKFEGHYSSLRSAFTSSVNGEEKKGESVINGDRIVV